MSIRLTTGSRIAETSSKGNQEKWLADGRWYKLDLFGYEGLAEAVTSALLAQTNTGALGFRYVTSAWSGWKSTIIPATAVPVPIFYAQARPS